MSWATFWKGIKKRMTKLTWRDLVPLFIGITVSAATGYFAWKAAVVTLEKAASAAAKVQAAIALGNATAVAVSHTPPVVHAIISGSLFLPRGGL